MLFYMEKQGGIATQLGKRFVDIHGRINVRYFLIILLMKQEYILF